MAERSSSSASGKYQKLFRTGSEAGKDTKNKKRRRRQQKKGKVDGSLENVQDAASAVLSIADRSEINPNVKELRRSSGESKEKWSEESARETQVNETQGSETTTLKAEAMEEISGLHEGNLAESALHSAQQSEGNLVSASGESALPKEEQAAGNEHGEGKRKVEDKSLDQQTTSKKEKKAGPLSFRRPKRSKIQKPKSTARETSSEKNEDGKDFGDAARDSGGCGTKSKSLDKERGQDQGANKEMAESKESGVTEQASNSQEDAKTVENKGKLTDVSVQERAQETTHTGSSKAKKFKPLASFRRHKKKADSSKSASADEDIKEKKELGQQLQQPASDGPALMPVEDPNNQECRTLSDVPGGVKLQDEVFSEENDEKVAENEDGENTEDNEDGKKSAGKTRKKFGPLRSFRRSKAKKKSQPEQEDAGKSKGKIDLSHESGPEDGNDKESELPPQEGDTKPSAASENLNLETTRNEDSEAVIVEGEQEIQTANDAAAEVEAMAPTKKEKKKDLFSRQMKKMWSTNGKGKQGVNVKGLKKEGSSGDDNAVKEENEIEECVHINNDGDQQMNSQNPESPSAEASKETEPESRKLATEEGEFKSVDLANEEVKKAEGEVKLEVAETKLNSDEMQSPQKATEKKDGLFGRQIKNIKSPIKKNKEEAKTKKESEEPREADPTNPTEDSTGASGVDDVKETTKQVKRKKTNFQKLSNALKKKKISEESYQSTDETEDQGDGTEVPRETDEEPSEESIPDSHDKAASCKDENGEENASQSGEEEQDKIEDNEDIKECPRERSVEEENESAEQGEQYRDVSSEGQKVCANLMRAVIQELLEKMAKKEAIQAGTPDVQEPDLEEDSELPKTAGDDDSSLTEITDRTTDDSSSMLADADIDDEGSEEAVVLSSEEDAQTQKTNEGMESQSGESNKFNRTHTLPTKDADKVTVETSSPECIPSTSGEGSHDDSPPVNEEKTESVPSQEDKNGEMTLSDDLKKSKDEVASDFESSQTVTSSRGRKEEWILVNRLEMSQELSHQLKVLALDSFEHATTGCCSLM